MSMESEQLNTLGSLIEEFKWVLWSEGNYVAAKDVILKMRALEYDEVADDCQNQLMNFPVMMLEHGV